MGKKVNLAAVLFYAVICMCVFSGCLGSRMNEKRQADSAAEDQEQIISDNKDQHSDNKEREISTDSSGQEVSTDSSGQEVSTDSSGREASADSSGREVSADNEEQEIQMFAEDEYEEKEIIESGPLIADIDWSEYFDGMNGAAVLYDASRQQCFVYNYDLAVTRRSPCSTFKIISSLIALEKGIIDPEHSTRTWSGETFWNEKWNRDIDFYDAFRESCVWYFRQVIDDIGEKKMQKELDRLQYGNCDISDWKGRLNTNNNNRALTGFWIESSLAVSPKEQTEVMERIFGPDSVYSEKTKNELKKVMLVPQQNKVRASIYGKTGMGMAHGVTVDAWFTGFAEHENGSVYFCIYLGQTDGRDVTSTAAKEIAIQIVSDYYN